jgi:endonuclease/exonuclease/phosphatase family metal-dependent hydrolase
MKIVTYNIQYSRGKDEKNGLPRIVGAIRNANIIALQEVERFWPRSGMSDQPAEISAMLPDHYWIYGPEMDLDASEVGGDGRVVNRRRQFGNMLLSRWPILSARNHLLPYVGTTSHSNNQATLLEGVIERDGRALRVYSLHLSHLSQRERLVQVDWLLDLNRRVWLEGGVWSSDPNWRLDPDQSDNGWRIAPMPPMPFDGLYLGDFNFDPADPEYDRLVGPLDPDYGRVHYRDLLVDAWVAAGNGESEGITYPPTKRYPKSPKGWRLDYCFVTPTLAGAVRRAWIDDGAQGSDHQPMWVELEL